jgi:16S rRNA (guanine966-N2)-methyltransferase
VRQAIFNILGPGIQGARVLDAFAGSGALGCEALSRGAGFVAFVDSDLEAVLCVRDNLGHLDADLPREAYRVLQLDMERAAADFASQETLFDVILLDPPYEGEAAKKALNALGDCVILAPTGVLIVEHSRRAMLDTAVGRLRQRRQHRYGDTVLSLYHLATP